MAPRYCKTCRSIYNDFSRSTTCPHPYFRPSQSAAKLLMSQGIDPYSNGGCSLSPERKVLIEDAFNKAEESPEKAREALENIPILPV